MTSWLERFLGRWGGGARNERLMALEGEARRLELALAEERARAERLKEALERERTRGDAAVEERARMEKEALLADAASAVAQLETQAHLLEGGAGVGARDVMAVARRLVGVLKDHGLRAEASVGETVAFDPDRHAPLRAGAAMARGDPAVVRFVGMRYGSRLLRKAGVERIEAEG